jgi:molecular chaperone GrpE (heat shock protein)
MNMVAFDTLKLARRLREAGMPQEQAEAVAQAEADALSEFVQSHLASKQDVSELKQEIADTKAELKQEIADTKAELKQEIAEVRADLLNLRAELKSEIASVIKWNIGTMVAMVAIVLAVLRLTG